MRACVYSGVIVSSRVLSFVTAAVWMAASSLVVAAAPSDPPKLPAAGQRQASPYAFRKSVPSTVDDLKRIEVHMQELIARVSPAVVSVQVGSSVGSAVVISEEGLALCAAHVCGEPGRRVRFKFPDGREAQGETLGTNHGIDSGLMRITQPGRWPYVSIAPAEGTRVGDWVFALGHPGGFDLDRTVVVRLGRVIGLGSFIQTDCTLISGDSGGPLFNVQGQVIGIHSRISRSTSDNYHVPISTYLETWDRLAQGQTWGDERPPPTPTIGVRAVDDPYGCRLDAVTPGGAGFAAGLQPGDVVLRANGELILDAQSFGEFIRQVRPGNDVVLLVDRDREELWITVKVDARRGRGGRWRPER